jgi:hypothetical protein
MRQTASRNGAKEMTETTEQLAVKIYRAQRDALSNLLMDVAQGRPSHAASAFYDFKLQDKAEAEAEITAYLDTVQERVYEARRLLEHLMMSVDLGTDLASEREAEAVIRGHFEAKK